MERGGIEIESWNLNEAFVRDIASKLPFPATFWVNLSYPTEGHVTQRGEQCKQNPLLTSSMKY